MASKPILYLDVDDTLISYPPTADAAFWAKHPMGAPALRVRQFLEEAKELCEIRWLTWWCPGGSMSFEQIERLSKILDVPSELLRGNDNPLKCLPNKTLGIDWREHDAGTPWVWIEDGPLLSSEVPIMRGRGVYDRWIDANVSNDPHALWRAWTKAKQLLHYSLTEQRAA